jgi:UvrD-like helicase family protein
VTEARSSTRYAVRDAEIAIEQRHVDRVYERVHVLRAEAERAHLDGHRLARTRTPGSLVERDAMVHHTARRLRALDAEYEGLVFGRLDLHGDGSDGEVRYVGRLGLRDVDHEPLVVDWRAPGAAAFYQATPEQPMGVVRRRVITCAGPRVLDVEDDLLDLDAAGFAEDGPADGAVGHHAVTVVGDGALLASLARARTGRMRDIVATIQREQDEAIRAPATGVTLVEGGPGTGKTAVALHRAAHLLYRDRRRFERAGVLLVGPSPIFMSYVERVLPSLGEDTVELRALGELVDGYRSDRLDPPALAALKGSPRMVRFLQRALRQGPPDAPAELRLVYAGQVLRVGRERLARIRATLHDRVRQSNLALREVRRVLIEALWQARPADASWSARRFAEEVDERGELDRFVLAWWPVLRPAQVLAWLADLERVRSAGHGWLSTMECEALAGSWRPGPAAAPDADRDPHPDAGPERLTVADVALLDELRVMLGELRPPARPKRDMGIDYYGDPLRELSTVAERYFAAPERAVRPDNYDGYAHVLVDEAQDVSPMQWRMLGRRGHLASWTIVGDLAQSAWPDPAQARRARDEALRGKRMQRFHLGTNYRNSAEVFELAARVVRAAVPDADLPVAVRRTGVAPEHRIGPVADLDAAVRDAVDDLLDDVDGTVGVITPSALRDDLALALADVVDQIAQPASRVQVVDGMHAKGMEYDAVVLVHPDRLVAESASGIRVLYVALSRATHRLITISETAEWLTGPTGQTVQANA